MTIAGPNQRSARLPKIRLGWRMALLLALPLFCTGCSIPGVRGLTDYIAYNDTTNDIVLGWRNSAWASRAWVQRRYQFANEPHQRTFGQGFRAGYMDVASGGNGCPPPLPPRRFWTWRYQSPEGQAKVAAWFAGFPYGAAAAAEEGAGNWQQIQIAPNVEAQYSPEFMCPVIPGFEDYYLPKHPNMVPPGMEGAERLPQGMPRDLIPAPNGGATNFGPGPSPSMPQAGFPGAFPEMGMMPDSMPISVPRPGLNGTAAPPGAYPPMPPIPLTMSSPAAQTYYGQ